MQELVTALPADLAARFLVVEVPLVSTGRRPMVQALPTTLSQAWDILVRTLFGRRGAPPQEVLVGTAASWQFARFHEELLAQAEHRSLEEQELLLQLPNLARRIALVLHQVADVPGPELTASHALAGIQLALESGNCLLRLRIRAEQEQRAAGAVEDRQRIVLKLRELGPTDFRSLYRSFNDQSVDRWRPVVDNLLAEGLVLEDADGRLSLVEQELLRLRTV